jgi:hypothetical protein
MTMLRVCACRSLPPTRSAVVLACAILAGCGRTQPAPAVATPTVTVNRTEVPLGGPLETRYRFVVADGASFAENYRVMVHVLDADDSFLWAEDFDPPTPTTSWRPGQTIEFSRRTFVPMYPYVGEATIQIGLYSVKTGQRLVLAGDEMGQHAYRAAKIRLLPQTSSILVVYKDGWQGVESVPNQIGGEWQWSKKDGVLAFRNPQADSVLYLDVDNPSVKQLGPQQVTVAAGDQTLDTFTVDSTDRILRVIPISAAQLGPGETAEVHVQVDKTFVPAEIDPASHDTRQLGVRVFHAYVDKKS